MSPTATVGPPTEYDLYKQERARGLSDAEAARAVAARFGRDGHPENVRQYLDHFRAKDAAEARKSDTPPPAAEPVASDDDFEPIRVTAVARAASIREEIASMAPEVLRGDETAASLQAALEAELADEERTLRNVTHARAEVVRRRHEEAANAERRREDEQAEQALRTTIERASRRVPA